MNTSSKGEYLSRVVPRLVLNYGGMAVTDNVLKSTLIAMITSKTELCNLSWH